MRRFALALSLLALFTTSYAADTPTRSNTAVQHYGTWGVDLGAMDRSVKPGDDFFRFVNGKWAETVQIPADKSSFGSFAILHDLSEARVHEILDRWAADKTLKPGSDEAKVATIYRTYLDETTVEKLDAKPMQPALDAVKNAKSYDDIARLMGRAHVDFGASFVRSFIGDDAKNPDKNTLYLGQGGLGLPDRDYYLRDNFKAQKERYQQYVAQMLQLGGWPEPEKNAADVVALETRIAEAHWPRAESRDRDKTYNPMTLAELEKYAPGFPWRVYFKEEGLDKAERAVVFQNTAMPKIAKVFAATPIDTLKAWEAFHVVDDAAPLLSKRFADAEWEFRSKFLNGTKEQRPRWKRAVQAAEGSMGEAVGREYVAEYFPPEAKAKAESLVRDILTALKARIEKLQWMEPETKARAIEKLAQFHVKIGYPSKWRDYSTLQVVEGELAGNVQRAGRFEWNRQLSRLNKPVDKAEWGMTPQTVNAYYNSTRNEIVFPAAILQPPFFDPKADPAVNYGGIGAVIGHDVTHGFDDQG
ncbi:MAG TPA: M13-type metalloendopeptidase, partial [Thermoanaerobaculia bacterium]|nr:M13-type metalloendopeptidase [Thermoanaerobaculia bacterium]